MASEKSESKSTSKDPSPSSSSSSSGDSITVRTDAASPEQYEQSVGGFGDLEVQGFERVDDDEPGMYEVTLTGNRDSLDAFAEARGIPRA